MNDSHKRALLERFSAWLDAAEAGSEPIAEQEQTADLFSLFVELAGLRTEVRTEARLVKEALDQFRSAFDTLQVSHATAQRELDRTREEAREMRRATLRPLLLDVIDLRDRLVAALAMSGDQLPHWPERLWRRQAVQGQAWQEGLRLTLQRLDQVLRDRGVEAIQSLGRSMDPRLARAVGTVPDHRAPAGTVVEEIRAGFVWEGAVLRTAEVIVSRPTANEEAAS
ncbi:nucleotide exchange factor GrpE [Paracraurococcus lichenis]|uniref:Protein GrpE n=1 Tax=Paracraurococcus lichenis TaxID=3064888 RepID=A0ABT9E8Z2_9PROT|nr:nucleotide exchange factor GrpE [Paracraurococcus sp. LOR1-02]MDO9712587.1 nucleotide exchange factor GrpE [Paracraurococcus sp. LOR1-02]